MSQTTHGSQSGERPRQRRAGTQERDSSDPRPEDAAHAAHAEGTEGAAQSVASGASAALSLLRAIAALGPRLHEPLASGTREALYALVTEGLRECGLLAFVALLDETGALHITHTSLLTEMFAQGERLLETNPIGYTFTPTPPFDAVITRGDVVVVDDIAPILQAFVPHLPPEQVDALRLAIGMERVIAAPLLARGCVIGALVIWGTRAQLAHDDAPAVAALAAQVGIAIENARLFRAVEAERARWQAVVDGMVEFMVTCDAEGSRTYFNASLTRFIGHELDPAIPRDVMPATYGLLRPDRTPYTTADLPLFRALASGMPITDVPMLLRRADGEERMTVWAASPIRASDGTLLGAVSVGRDVSGQRLLEQQSQAALTVLLRVAHIVGDASVSTTAAELLPRVAEALLDLEAADITHALLLDEREHVLPLATFGGTPEFAEVWAREIAHFDPATQHHPGSIVGHLRAGRAVQQRFDKEQPTIAPLSAEMLHVRAAVIGPVLVDGRCIGALVVTRTRPAQLETGEFFPPWEVDLVAGVARLVGEALATTALSERLRTAEAARLAAAEATRQRDEFLAVASHELKTPLTSLKAYAQVGLRRINRFLAAAPDPARDAASWRTTIEALRQSLDRIEFSAERLQLLVDDLLDVVRIESGKLQLRLGVSDLRPLCEITVEEQRQATEREIGLVLPPAPVLVRADSDRITQVLVNLLSNAVRYSSEESPVTLTLRVEGEQAVVSVRDEGPGIPAEEQTAIFERFHRVPSSVASTGTGAGLGLGLYISREIVERHGGRIWVESSPGAGATFSFTLPLASTGD